MSFRRGYRYLATFTPMPFSVSSPHDITANPNTRPSTLASHYLVLASLTKTRRTVCSSRPTNDPTTSYPIMARLRASTWVLPQPVSIKINSFTSSPSLRSISSRTRPTRPIFASPSRPTKRTGVPYCTAAQPQPSVSAVNMSDIYQQIIDVDIAQSSGIQALLPFEERNADTGYIVVTESSSSTSPGRLFAEVSIPPSKQRSYDLARALFDNYDLEGDKRDVITDAESAERDALLDFALATPPMQLARQYVQSVSGTTFTWISEVITAWFHTFTARSGDPTRSGFEHVLLGEWNTRSDIVGGFHWWYYYLMNRADLTYGGAKYGSSNSDAASGIDVPDLVTMSFEWDVADGQTIPKSTGGFFAGPSVEAMLAMGMVRRAATTEDSQFFTVSGMELNMRMFRSEDGKDAINTWFPILLRVVSGTVPTNPNPGPPPVEGAESGIRLISIVSNPEGPQDAGKEKVTVINMFGDGDVNVNGWRVQGPNKTALVLGNVTLKKGEAITITVRKSDGLQLSNSGGEVTLLRPDGSVAQRVNYASSVARVQGGVLVWNGEDDLVIYKQ